MKSALLALAGLAAALPCQAVKVTRWPDGVVSSSGLHNKKGDPAHFDAKSLREFSRRYAKQMLRVRARQK